MQLLLVYHFCLMLTRSCILRTDLPDTSWATYCVCWSQFLGQSPLTSLKKIQNFLLAFLLTPPSPPPHLQNAQSHTIAWMLVILCVNVRGAAQCQCQGSWLPHPHSLVGPGIFPASSPLDSGSLHANHLGILLKWWLSFSSSRVGPGSLHF